MIIIIVLLIYFSSKSEEKKQAKSKSWEGNGRYVAINTPEMRTGGSYPQLGGQEVGTGGSTERAGVGSGREEGVEERERLTGRTEERDITDHRTPAGDAGGAVIGAPPPPATFSNERYVVRRIG